MFQLTDGLNLFLAFMSMHLPSDGILSWSTLALALVLCHLVSWFIFDLSEVRVVNHLELSRVLTVPVVVLIIPIVLPHGTKSLAKSIFCQVSDEAVERPDLIVILGVLSGNHIWNFYSCDIESD